MPRIYKIALAVTAALFAASCAYFILGMTHILGGIIE